ncbi:MAG: hypothetical protein Q4E44_02785 [bacterium]|nr:hypothetical protein [bacterium]
MSKSQVQKRRDWQNRHQAQSQKPAIVPQPQEEGRDCWTCS